MSLSALIEHENHRQAGRPAVSALRGPVAAAVSCWRAWCRASDRPAVVVQGVDPDHWGESYIDVFLRDCRPREVAQAAVLERAQREPGNFSPEQLSLHQWKLLFERAGLGEDGADRLCRGLLESFARREAVTSKTVGQWFADDFGNECWLAVLKAIVEFLPPGKSPALLVVPVAEAAWETPAASDHLTAIEQAAGLLARVIAEIPSAAVGLAASAPHFDDYLRSAPESFSKAVLRESLATVSGLSAKEISKRLTERLGRTPEEYLTHIERLSDRGATAATVERFVDAVLEREAADSAQAMSTDSATAIATGTEAVEPQSGSHEDTSSPEPPDAARSATERFLYDVLENTPDLAGLFQLNIRPGFVFGNRPAEIDLACLSKKIAVELDGYYHFTDREAYRRDRRKDALLQRHGFFVLRFLAEDVVPELEFICQSIRSIVQLRDG